MAELGKQILAQYEKDKAERALWEPLFEECYDYALPQRESFYSERAGQRRDDKIFDETAVVGVQEFASRMQSGLVPNFARWADFISGTEVPPEDRDALDNDLEEVTEYVFEILQNSNFTQEVHESFLDLAVGTGVLSVDEGDAINPVVFSALPLPRVVLGSGPDDRVDRVYRIRQKTPYKHLSLMYPKAKLDDTFTLKADSEEETDVVEVIRRDYSQRNEEAYEFVAVCTQTKKVIYKEMMKGIGSNPIVVFRWSKASGETYGRGPLLNALSAIKTTNLTIELILENAQMQISGIYQMEDDGVINPDTIQLIPGSIIPKAAGSAGLQPINAAGRFDVASLILDDMRNNIKRALYNEMLGDPNRTPATATEIAERMADLSRRIGSAFGRLQAEMVQPVLQRVVYILKKQGRIELPTVNGREIKIRSTSPLAQAQANQDISAVARWAELVGTIFGPEMLQLLVDGEQTAVHLAKKFGVPDRLIRDENQRKQIAQAAQMIAMQQQMGGANAGPQGQLGDGRAAPQ